MKTIQKITALSAILLILAGGLVSCNEQEPEGCTNTLSIFGINFDDGVGKITAKIYNSSAFCDVVEIKLMVYDRNVGWHVEFARSKKKYGGFKIELPQTLAQNFLNPLIRSELSLGGRAWPGIREREIQPSLIISNENVRVDNNYLLGIDKNGRSVGTFLLLMKDEEGTFIPASFTYVNSDVTISGYTRYDFQIQPNWSERLIKIYSIDWKKGWNIWSLLRNTTSTDNMFIVEDLWSTTPISELKWIFAPHGIL